MAKRLVVVEIECPTGFDACWDEDKTGLQVYHDTVVLNALSGSMASLVLCTKSLVEKGTPQEDFEQDAYYQFITRKIDISDKATAVGYIDEDGVIVMVK